MPNTKVIIHRVISWLLVPLATATIYTGYSLTHGWFDNYYRMATIHRVFEWIFLPILIAHIIYTAISMRANWSRMISNIKNRRATFFYVLKITSRVTSWLIIITAIFVVLSGLNGYEWYASSIGKVIPFEWHRIFDSLLTIFIIIHVAIGVKFVLIRNKVKSIAPNTATAIATSALITIIIIAAIPNSTIFVPPEINPGINASLRIGTDSFDFNSSLVETVRPDIFADGAFSLFDILVHLEQHEKLNMTYHFDPLLNTHVIDSLDGKINWWYYALYSGGWRENNVFRMDHYPWKEGTTFVVYTTSEDFISDVYEYYREETLRLEENNGAVIIPEIRIIKTEETLVFNDITVTPHNLRNDLFQEDIITAIDVIMTLGDLGEISYTLQWYDEIGSADIVRNYFINSIDDDVSFGTCGFVYEAGAERFGFDNHIHIPSDAQVLNSPEYAKWFWICL